MAFGAELPCGPDVGISGSMTHLQGEAVGGQAIQGPSIAQGGPGLVDARKPGKLGWDPAGKAC